MVNGFVQLVDVYLTNGVNKMSSPIKQLSRKEFNLIMAMRKVVSQDNKYEVHVIIRNHPTGYIITEYHDTFEV
jgi:hypothetical protein